MFTPCSNQTYGNLVLQYFWIYISLHKREREREGFAPFNPSLVLWNNSHFRCLQPRCSSILLAKLFSNSSITLKLQVWMKNLGKGTSHRQTDHMRMYIILHCTTCTQSHRICHAPRPSHRSCHVRWGSWWGLLAPAKSLLGEGFFVFCFWEIMFLADGEMWGELRWSTPKKIRYLMLFQANMVENMGAKSWPTTQLPPPWCVGCCPCPRVSRLAFKGVASWTKESQQENWQLQPTASQRWGYTPWN